MDAMWAATQGGMQLTEVVDGARAGCAAPMKLFLRRAVIEQLRREERRPTRYDD